MSVAVQVVARAGRAFVEHDLLGDPPAQKRRDVVQKLLARGQVLVLAGQAHRVAKRHPARQNADLMDRVGKRQQFLNDSVAQFVVGDNLFFALV